MIPYAGPGNYIHLDARLWRRDALGSVRSRELTPCYLTRYRAARGEGQLAVSRTWEFSCILAGRGQLRSSPCLGLEPGTVYLIPPGIQHAESSDGTLESVWMGLKGTQLPEPNWNGPRSVCSPYLTKLFEQAWQLAQYRSAGVGQELDGLARAILGGFLRLAESPQMPRGEELVQEAIRLMYAGFQSPFSVSAMARQLGCSVGYFQRTFRQITEMSPARYLARIRLQHALMWLESTDLTVAEIAPKVGYADSLYFSRVMRKATGLSPTQFRARNKRQAETAFRAKTAD